MPNTWRTLIALIVLVESMGIELSHQDIVNLFTLSENCKDIGRYILSPRKDPVVIFRNPISVKEWKDRYFFARGFTELNNGEPLEFFIPQTYGSLSNSFSFVELFL